MKRLRRLATGVNGAAIAFCAAGFLLPDPDHWCSPALSHYPGLRSEPWRDFNLVSLRRAQHRSALDSPTTDTAGVFILTCSAVSEVETLDWKGPAMLASRRIAR